MKIFLLSLLFAVKAFGVDGSYFPDVKSTKNFVKNPSCAKNAQGITASGGSLARGTTTPLDPDSGSECTIDASSSGQTYTWALKTWSSSTAQYLKNSNCEAFFVYEGDASLYKAYVSINGANVTGDYQLLNSSSSATPVKGMIFPCGDLSNAPTFVIESTSASAAEISAAKVYVGEAFSVSPGTVVTNWTLYTPTYGSGFGTVATSYMFWRRIGDTLEIQGQFNAGTPAASVASLSLPLSLTASVTSSGGNNQSVGRWENNDGNGTKAKSGHLLAADADNLLYFANSDYTPAISGQTHANGTSVATSATQMMWVNAKVKITGWTSEDYVSTGRQKAPTSTVLTSGSSATYTTPPGAVVLKIRMVGGGGGGGGSDNTTATSGGSGGNTIFSTNTANGGNGGAANVVNSAWGTGGAGTGYTAGLGTTLIAMNGASGGSGLGISSTVSGIWANGGTGGSSPFGGSGEGGGHGNAGNPAIANSGSGGGGGAGGSGVGAGGGGASGSYIEFYIVNPSSTYTYTIGAAGAAGTGSTSAGGAGGSGVIVIEEYYSMANVPILVGSVTTKSNTAYRIESYLVGNQAGGCTMFGTSDTGATGSSPATGKCKITFGTAFSAAPICTANINYQAGNTIDIAVIDSNTAVPTTTSVNIASMNFSGIYTNGDGFHVICMGPR